MSNPSTVPHFGHWAYWPSSDRYQLTPKWDEWHADTDRTVQPGDEKNRLELVGDWWADNIDFTMTLRDASDQHNPQVPEDEPELISRVWATRGWLRENRMLIEKVYEDDVWNGDLIARFGPIKEWLGHSVPHEFTIDALFPERDNERVRIGYGTITLRR